MPRRSGMAVFKDVANSITSFDLSASFLYCKICSIYFLGNISELTCFSSACASWRLFLALDRSSFDLLNASSLNVVWVFGRITSHIDANGTAALDTLYDALENCFSEPKSLIVDSYKLFFPAKYITQCSRPNAF